MQLDHKLAFIAGYIDGDGSVCARSPSISITGNATILGWIKGILDKFSPNKTRTKESMVRPITKASEGVSEYGIAGRRAEKVIRTITGMGLPLMQRKWKNKLIT